MCVVLGQTATSKKSNDIEAIPEFLEMLDIEGGIVTIDAMGTQTKIARTIRARGVYYVLCVKDSTSRGHGRTEVRSASPPRLR